MGCDPLERPELGACVRVFASGAERWGWIVAGSCPGSTASRNYQRGEECCVLCVGRVSQAIPFLILSPLLCADQTPGEDRTAGRCSVLPLLTVGSKRGGTIQHSPLLAFPLGQHCLLPLLCNPKVRRTLFDPAAGAVASLLLQRFSNPSFSLSQSQYWGSGKLSSWAEEEPAVSCPGRGKGFPQLPVRARELGRLPKASRRVGR